MRPKKIQVPHVFFVVKDVVAYMFILEMCTTEIIIKVYRHVCLHAS